ncbi:MAG: ABC transporter substrate-binding protein [Myxococcota bacterium]
MTSSPRIASLVPGGTDLVAALDLADHLVGVSHECDHPARYGKPILTRSALFDGNNEPPRDPRTVDTRVTETARSGQPLYLTDRDELRELSPDLIVAQAICDVCAVTPAQAGADLPEGARLLELTATTVEGLYTDLERLGEATGRAERALDVIEEVRTRLARIHERVGTRRRPKVVTLEWSDPPYIGGHWVPEMVFLAGGEHALRGPGERSIRIDVRAIREADPDVVVFMPCGYDLEGALDEAAHTLAGWDLRAVRQGNLWATDANTLFSRCTPHSVARGTEVLAAILHPDLFDPPTDREAQRVRPA